MATVFQILSGSTWHDYSDCIEWKGLKWSRDDVDGNEAGRTMDAEMHRAKIAAKRNLSFKICESRQARLAALDDDLSQETFTARYLDLHGVMEKEFYCSKFSADLYTVYDEDGIWGNGSFNIHEI